MNCCIAIEQGDIVISVGESALVAHPVIALRAENIGVPSDDILNDLSTSRGAGTHLLAQCPWVFTLSGIGRGQPAPWASGCGRVRAPLL